MKTIFLLLLITHGCISTRTQVKAYSSEIECNEAASKEVLASDFFTSKYTYCESAEALLKQTKGEK